MLSNLRRYVIVASENYRFPRDNADSFVVLIEEGVLHRELEAALRAMAGFRNRLVHLYWNFDDARVFEYLQDSVGDFESFATAIAARDW